MTFLGTLAFGLYLSIVVVLGAANTNPIEDVSVLVVRQVAVPLAFIGEPELPRSAECVFIENAASHTDPRLASQDHVGSVAGVNVCGRRMLASLEQQNWRHQSTNGYFPKLRSICSGADGRYDGGSLTDVFKLNVDPAKVTVFAFKTEQLHDEEGLLYSDVRFDRASGCPRRSGSVQDSGQDKDSRYAAYNKLPEGNLCGLFGRFRHAPLLTQIVLVLAIGGTASWLVWRGGWISIDRPRTGLAMLICAMLLLGSLLGSLLWCVASGNG